jgi:hypothetical protein
MILPGDLIMSRLLKLLVILIAYVNCGSKDSTPNIFEPPLENVLTLELTFGDEGLSDDFLLVRPYGNSFGVNNNQIFVRDEDYIKVYTTDGVEKTRFGGKGEGPGEISGYGSMNVGLTGYIVVRDSRGLSFFNPDFSFHRLHRVRGNSKYDNYMESNNFRTVLPEKAIPLDNTTWVVKHTAFHKERDVSYRQNTVLMHETDDTYFEIVQYNSKRNISSGRMNSDVLWRGDLSFDISDNNMLVYYRPEDKYDSVPENPEYKLIFVHLKSLSHGNPEADTLYHRYEAVFVPDSLKEIYTDYLKTGLPDDANFKKDFDGVGKILENDKYYSSLQKIIIDDNIVFAVTNLLNDKEEYLVDIFDVEKKQYLRSAYFSVVPDEITDGFTYKVKNVYNTLPTVEKYRIDPAVYGK